MDALTEAREYLSAYQYRINQDNYRGDLESRTRYENCAYQEGMLQAAIAQAEQLKRIADLLERYVGPAPLPDAERDEYIRNSYPGESIREYQQRIYGPLAEPSPLDNF